jgi:hypothetical protein
MISYFTVKDPGKRRCCETRLGSEVLRKRTQGVFTRVVRTRTYISRCNRSGTAKLEEISIHSMISYVRKTIRLI